MRSMTSPARGRGQTVPPRTDLGRLIRLARESHDPKITQEELADKVGIRQSQLSKIERGETERPMKETIRLIAEALDVDPDPLFIAADYAPEGDVHFDPWLKSIGEMSPEDFERLKVAVREREEYERRHGRGNGRQ